MTLVFRAYILGCCHHYLLLHCTLGAFFPKTPVGKCLFPCCGLVFPWRPIGMHSLVAAACKNRKQSRQQIHTAPYSVFSPFISSACCPPPSLAFILPHTPRIRGLCHVLWNRVLLLLTKARNSICIWPTL